jgi:hypothetical protein
VSLVPPEPKKRVRAELPMDTAQQSAQKTHPFPRGEPYQRNFDELYHRTNQLPPGVNGAAVTRPLPGLPENAKLRRPNPNCGAGQNTKCAAALKNS